MDGAFGVVVKKSSPYPRSSGFSSILSSRSFIALPFTCKPLIHFELIFVKGVKSVSRFIFFDVNVQLSQHHLWKTLSLLHCIAFAPLSKTVFMWVCFWLSVLFY